MTLTAGQLATIAAVASVTIPPVVSLLKQEHWQAWIKQAVALAASVAAAVVGIAITVTDWSAVNLSTLAALAFTGSQVVYQAYFRGSATSTALTAIGSRPAPAPAQPPAQAA